MNGGQWQAVWWPEGGSGDRGEDVEEVVVRVTSNAESPGGAGHLDGPRPREYDL